MILTAKEYLNQIYLLEARYEAKREQANDMRLLAESTGAIRYDKEKIQTSPSQDALVNTVIRIIEAESEAAETAKELMDIKCKIIEQIISLDDEKYMRILCLRYVHHIKLDDVADRMHYNPNYIRQMHIKALEMFEETYPEIRNI